MNIILKGSICYSISPLELSITDGGYLVCEGGQSRGVYGDFSQIPDRFKGFPVTDCGEHLIIPGLCDLHTHAPQYAFRGLGMDLQLIEWLDTYTYPEESKYADIEYTNKAYDIFVNALKNSATTRACIFATTHVPATTVLMEKLECSGIVSKVGLVNMDRNCPDGLRSRSVHDSLSDTGKWIEDTQGRFKNTKPILTPRFIPTCSDELMIALKTLQERYNLPVQSHLSENVDEIKWVKELCPDAGSYAGAYDKFGLFGGGVPTLMAHCVYLSDGEKDLMRERGVYAVHCPASNTNIASGIAPVRDLTRRGINVGLGSDVAGGTHLSIFRAMSDAVQVSKLYRRLVDSESKPLSTCEAFYIATLGGGSFFGKVGSFEDGYEFDAVIIDDSALPEAYPLTTRERLERLITLGCDERVTGKYVRGEKIPI